MEKINKVFIATSIDGYIADKDGGLDWLNSIPNPENNDMGYIEFIDGIDAIVMGRITYETVLGFGVDWPYTKPVFVLSNSITKVPEKLDGKVFLSRGTAAEILSDINQKGYNKLYIDGGTTIQMFLREDKIDEIVITTIPVLLGGGFPLFAELLKPINFELVGTKVFLDNIVQNHYLKRKD